MSTNTKKQELEFPHTVTKPWGSETWLELNDSYCYKMITLLPGKQTSLQYHNKKLETNYVTAGEGVLTIGPTVEDLREISFMPGDYVTIEPGIIHRITATSTMVLLEVSTPEVDDVIRIEDDAGRPDGRIDSEHDSKSV